MPEPVSATPSQGQGVSTAQAAAQAQAASAQEAAPFFEYTLPSGEKESYSTQASLTQAYRDSYLRQSDYTRKTQELSQLRRAHDDEKKKFSEEQKAFLKQREKYDGWDQTLRSRPDLMRALEERFSQPMDANTAVERAQGYADEKTQALMERLEALEKQNQEATTKREIDEAFSGLKGKYPDADEAAIMESLGLLSDGKVGPLIEQLHWATKGRTSPAAVEKKIVEALQKKQGAGMIPPAPSQKGAPPKFKTTKEAREAAFAEEGVSPG